MVRSVCDIDVFGCKHGSYISYSCKGGADVGRVLCREIAAPAPRCVPGLYSACLHLSRRPDANGNCPVLTLAVPVSEEQEYKKKKRKWGRGEGRGVESTLLLCIDHASFARRTNCPATLRSTPSVRPCPAQNTAPVRAYGPKSTALPRIPRRLRVTGASSNHVRALRLLHHLTL